MKFSILIEKLIPTGAGDWKTRSVSSMIFIQSAWLSTYLFRLNGEYKTTLGLSGNSRILHPLCGCLIHRSVLFC